MVHAEFCYSVFLFTYLFIVINLQMYAITTSSADADNRRDAFSGQSRSTNMVPFLVRCDFSLSM